MTTFSAQLASCLLGASTSVKTAITVLIACQPAPRFASTPRAGLKAGSATIARWAFKAHCAQKSADMVTTEPTAHKCVLRTARMDAATRSPGTACVVTTVIVDQSVKLFSAFKAV